MTKPTEEELKQTLTDLQYAVTQETQQNALFQENMMTLPRRNLCRHC